MFITYAEGIGVAQDSPGDRRFFDMSGIAYGVAYFCAFIAGK
jgi:hypothetical protein